MKRILLGCVALVSLVSFQAVAEEFEMKRNEVSVFGSIDNSSQTAGATTTDSTTTYVSGHYGRYFTSKLVGDVGVFLMQTGSGTTAMTMEDVGVGVKYYFINGKFVSPFIMGDVGISNLSGSGFSGSGFMADFAGGVAFWLTETTALNLDLKLKHDEISVAGATVSTDHAMLEVGLTTKF